MHVLRAVASNEGVTLHHVKAAGSTSRICYDMVIPMSPQHRLPRLHSDRVCIILTCSLGMLHSMPQCWPRRWSNMVQQHGMPAVAALSAYRGDVHAHCYFADGAYAAFASNFILCLHAGWLTRAGQVGAMVKVTA
jgi:hypothetical protein